MASPNQGQRAQWNGDSGTRWVADADRRDKVLRPVLDALLDAADIQASEHVLDIGCGCGATTIAARNRVVTGKALGLDLSAPMLAVARERSAGEERISFLEADAQIHPFDESFDAVISRFGTMFFDDPIAAHRNLATAVRPGGRLCVATWQPLDENDWLLVPGAVLLRYGTMPAADNGPGMFAQADPDAATAVLHAAGWTEVIIDAVTLELSLGDNPLQATDYLADTGIARRVLETIDEADRAKALDEVTELLGDYMTDAVRLNAGINIIRARRR